MGLMESKVKRLEPIVRAYFPCFLANHCHISDEAICSLKELSLAFALYLLDDKHTRQCIAPFIDKPVVNIQSLHKHICHIMPHLLTGKPFHYIENDHGGIILGVYVCYWPNPIKTSDGVHITLKD